MLIPSIDLMGGRVVQLERGETLRLAFDDVDAWIERFADYPLVQLVDLDAAKRVGDNRALVERIARRLPVQVGGGIRTPEQAAALLEAGARRVIVGSALFEANAAATIAAHIGAQCLVGAIDARAGRIAVHGWREEIAMTPAQAITELEPFCGAFLYTHIDTEGTLQGFPLEVALELRSLTRRQLIVAGGIRSRGEIAHLEAWGVDAVVGMALYTARM